MAAERTYHRNRDNGIPGTQFAVDPNDQGTTTLTLPSESNEKPIAPGRIQPGDYVGRAPATWFGVVYQDEVNIDTGLTDEEFDTMQNSYLDAVLYSDEVFYSDWLTDEELAERPSYTAADFDDASRERAVRDLHSFLSENTNLITEVRAEYDRKGVTNPLQRIASCFWQARTFNLGFLNDTQLNYATAEALNEAAEKYEHLQSYPRGRHLTF